MLSVFLIVTSKFDEHADYIINICNGKNLSRKIVRLNTENFLDNVVYTFDGRMYSLHIIDSDISFTSHDVDVVWYRRPLDFDLLYEDSGIKNFIKSQTDVFLKGLYYATHKTAFWINDLRANLFAKNKLLQISIARDVGFNVPECIVSNDASCIEAFAYKNFPLCNKSLDKPSYSLNGKNYPYMTRKVSSINEIIDNRDSLNMCPTFFESYIEKKYDVRVVVFGDKIFPFAIYSQDNTLSSIDVRGVDPTKLKHEYINLPIDIEQRVIAYVKKQGLFFSSMDLVCADNEKFYFIENNCNGQWLWLEYLTGIKMSEYFIETVFKL